MIARVVNFFNRDSGYMPVASSIEESDIELQDTSVVLDTDAVRDKELSALPRRYRAVVEQALVQNESLALVTRPSYCGVVFEDICWVIILALLLTYINLDTDGDKDLLWWNIAFGVIELALLLDIHMTLNYYIALTNTRLLITTPSWVCGTSLWSLPYDQMTNIVVEMNTAKTQGSLKFTRQGAEFPDIIRSLQRIQDVNQVVQRYCSGRLAPPRT
eukprot:gnl/Hemi2/28623_TR9495_c0_g1_i1.p2 gnl/Hemi2/28623_TR9495_c0_g1~~gnl/Hemi2/28623_TR9495_c0_g1_i1.p2  ORF type:complete len:216 (+),score=45.48 gnl/Hemi2/28623_TR9495_c0_g1_i1:130-777(+)